MVSATPAIVQRPRVFYSVIAFAVLVVVLVGFVPGYIRPPEMRPPLVHAHAAVFLAWTLLLLTQAALVARGNVALHRRLGLVGALLLLLMLPLGYATAIGGARRGHPMWIRPDQSAPEGFPFADSLQFLTVPLGDLLVLAVFGGIALWCRRRPEIHRRAMLLATIGGMVPPAATRLPLGGPAVATVLMLLLFLGACLAHDYYERGRPHALNVWGSLGIIASVPARVVLAQTPVWRSFAEWLVR